MRALECLLLGGAAFHEQVSPFFGQRETDIVDIYDDEGEVRRFQLMSNDLADAAVAADDGVFADRIHLLAFL